MTLGGILEFFLGNTFSFVVFCSYGKHGQLGRRDVVDNWIDDHRRFLAYAWEHFDAFLQCLWRLLARPKSASGRHHQCRVPRQLRYVVRQSWPQDLCAESCLSS